jgi:ubiquinone/menaquinone biosynthesis C-methylase UbiE
MSTNLDPTSFDEVDAGEPDYFIRFLDARGTIDGENEVKALISELVDARPGLAILDVGSGTGTDAAELAAGVVPGGRVIGADISAAMVEEAQRRTDDSGLPVQFVEADAAELGFGDGLFDRCRAERVLMAMPDPARAVREMVRVTRPGGVVVLSEMDAGTIFLNSSDTALTRRLVTGFADALPSPAAGRRLHRYLMEAGLEDVRCATTVILNPVSFLRLLFGARLEGMVAAGEASATDVALFWAELEQGEREGWLCSGGVCFTAAGRKPQR